METKELTNDILIASYDQCDAYEDDIYDELVDEMNYDDALLELTTFLENCDNAEKAFKISVTGFGWRDSSGETMSILKDGKDLLSTILPNTPCTWKAYQTGKDNLVIRNWHHDSPMGNEYYYVEPVDIVEFYEWKEAH